MLVGAAHDSPLTPGELSSPRRGWPKTRTAARAGLLLAVLLTVAGCSLRNDPHYNRFAPTADRPAVLKRADGLVTSAEHALDNAEQRVENIID
jgi:hypothetical protein